MLKFQQFDRRTGEITEIKPLTCNFGITEALVPIIAGLAGSAGIGTATAGIIGSIAAPALVSAGLGAGTSALFGGNIGQGALLGGLGGALGPSLSAMGLTGSGGALSALTPAASQAAQNIESGNTGASAGLDAEGNPIGSYATGAAGMNPAAAAGVANPSTTSGATSNISKGLSALTGGNGGAMPGLGLPTVLGVLAALSQSAKQGTPTTPPPVPGATTPWNPTPSGTLARTTNPFTPTTGSYYTYGQQAEPQFFNNNQLSFTPVPMAKGGALHHAMRNGRYAQGGYSAIPQFSTGSGDNYVHGPGDGQSDQTPAFLSNGEYVLTASDVSRIGQGSNDAGAKKLDHMREEIAHDAGAKKFQGRVKPPLTYLREAA